MRVIQSYTRYSLTWIFAREFSAWCSIRAFCHFIRFERIHTGALDAIRAQITRDRFRPYKRRSKNSNHDKGHLWVHFAVIEKIEISVLQSIHWCQSVGNISTYLSIILLALQFADAWKHLMYYRWKIFNCQGNPLTPKLITRVGTSSVNSLGVYCPRHWLRVLWIQNRDQVHVNNQMISQPGKVEK